MFNLWKTADAPKKLPETLFGGCELPAFAKGSPVLERLVTISSERHALNAAREASEQALEKLREEAERIGAQRIELLADIARTEAETPPQARGKDYEELADRAAGMLREAESKRQAAADTERVIAALRVRAEAFDAELATLRQQYQAELGNVLTGIFQHLCAQYMAEAPAVADLLVKIAAVQDVMLHFMTGNSNGFARRAYLPRLTPGKADTPAPLLDCAAGLASVTESYRKQIIGSLAAAGYRWRFEP